MDWTEQWVTEKVYKDMQILSGFLYENSYVIPLKEFTVRLNLQTGKEENTYDKDLSFFSRVIIGNKLMFNSFTNNQIGLFNLNLNKPFWQRDSANLPFLKFHSTEHNLIIFKKSVITCLSRSNGDILWQKDFSKEGRFCYTDYTYRLQSGRLKKCIAINNDKVYLAINNDALLILDIKTGKTIKFIREMEEGNTWQTGKQILHTIPLPLNAVHLPAENKISCIIDRNYWELDLENDELHFFDTFEDFEKTGINSTSNIPFLVDGANLIFCSDQKQISVFDTITKKIVWNYKFDFEENNALWKGTISHSDYWMMINDKKKNTYIFQKTTADL